MPNLRDWYWSLNVCLRILSCIWVTLRKKVSWLTVMAARRQKTEEWPSAVYLSILASGMWGSTIKGQHRDKGSRRMEGKVPVLPSFALRCPSCTHAVKRHTWLHQADVGFRGNMPGPSRLSSSWGDFTLASEIIVFVLYYMRKNTEGG